MVSVEETARALHGVYRIAMFDRAGVSDFGRDLKSCARSFWAYAFALPATLLLLAINVSVAHTDQPYLLAVSSIISDVVQVAGFPLLLLPVLRWFGRSERWPWFITGYNWFSMGLAIASTTLVCLIVSLPLGGMRDVVAYSGEAYFYVLEAFLAYAVLEIGAWRAAAVLLLDIAFQFGVDRIANWIGGVN